MGTVVFPQAALKIFLSATPEERALTRYNQLKGKDSAVTLAPLSREIAARARQDASRPVAPLVPAEDAVIIDSTALTVVQVVDAVWRLGALRGLWNSGTGRL
jgi:cytidylate kinase